MVKWSKSILSWIIGIAFLSSIVLATQSVDTYFYQGEDLFSQSNDTVLQLPTYNGTSTDDATYDYGFNAWPIILEENITYDASKNAYNFDSNFSWIDLNQTPTILSKSVNAQSGEPRAFWFHPNGTYLYMAESVGNNILYYSLSTPWDISTLTYIGAFASGMTDPAGIYIHSNGTRFWVQAYGSDMIREYNMSVAWNMSTANFVNVNISTLAYDVTPLGLYFSSDGTKFYLPCITPDLIYQFEMTSPWNISTAVKTKQYYNGVYEVGVGEVVFNSDGTKMWTAGSSDNIVEYILFTPWDISTASTMGKRLYTGLQETAGTGMFWSSDGTSVYYVGTTADTIFQYTLDVPFDVYNYKYGTPTDEVYRVFRKHSYDFDSRLSDGFFGVNFNDDGTKMYALSTNTYDLILQFNLSTPYDIKTSSTTDKEFNVSNEDTSTRSLFLSPDGTKLFTVGGTADKFIQYNLGTAWDISTAAYVANVSYTTATDGWQMFISSDGLNLYMADNGVNYYYQYVMAQAWNISTLTYVRRLANGLETTPTTIWFNSSGTAMFIGGQIMGMIRKYYLSTPWDISTATTNNEQITISQEISVISGTFSSDGKYLYMTGTNLDSIEMYNLTNAWAFDEPDSGFCISAWTNAGSIGETTGRIVDFSISTGGDRGYALWIQAGRVGFQVGSGTAQYSDVNSVAFNTLYNILYSTNANGKVNSWVNGVATTGYTGSTTPVWLITNTPVVNTRIGNRANAIDRTFNGTIGRVMILNRECTVTDVAKIYAKGSIATYPYFGIKGYLVHPPIYPYPMRCDRYFCYTWDGISYNLDSPDVMLHLSMRNYSSNSTYTKDYSDFASNGNVSGAVYNAADSSYAFRGFNATDSIRLGPAVGALSNLDFTTEDFSVFAWVYPNTNDAGIIYDDRYEIQGGDSGWLFGLTDNGALVFDLNGDSDNAVTESGDNKYVANQWQMVGVVKNANFSAFYVNDTMVSNVTFGLSGTVVYAINGHWIGKIGDIYYNHSYGIPNRYFNGSISKFIVFNHSLGLEEEKNLYAQGRYG